MFVITKLLKILATFIYEFSYGDNAHFFYLLIKVFSQLLLLLKEGKKRTIIMKVIPILS